MTQTLEGSEYCIPIILSPLVTTTSDSITVSVGSDNARFVVDNIVEVTREGERIEFVNSHYLCRLYSDLKDTYNFFCTIGFDKPEPVIYRYAFDESVPAFTLNGLRSGYRYTIKVQGISGVDDTVDIVAVTSCSCDDSLVGKTGRPQNFTIYQDHGFVMFNFTDNSYCEEGKNLI